MNRQPRYMRYALTFFMAMPFLFIFLACQKEDPALPVVQLKLSLVKGNSATLAFLAKEKAFFAEEFLDVELVAKQSGKAALAMLLEDKANLALASEFAFVSRYFDQSNLKIVATLSSFRNKAILSSKKKGIRSPQDMKGRKIGVTRKSGGEYFLGSFLSSKNIQMDEVEVIDLKPKKIIEGIFSGELDVGLTWDPYIFQAKKLLGNDAIEWKVQNEQSNFLVLIGKREWLEKNQEIVKRLLKGLIKAEQYAKNHPGEVKEFLERTFHYEGSYLESVVSNNNFEILLPHELVSFMEKEAKWRIEQGLAKTDKQPDIKGSIYFPPLESVKSDLVTINKSSP